MRCVQRGGDAGEGGKASPRGRCSAAVASPRPWSGYIAPRSRIQGGMGDVVEEVRLDVDRDTADAAGHGGDPSRCPPPWPTPTKTGIPTFARAGEGLQGTQAPIRGSMSGRIKRHLHLPQPSSHSPQRSQMPLLPRPQSTSQTVRDGICDTILVRLVLDIDAAGQPLHPTIVAPGHPRAFARPLHFRDPKFMVEEIPIRHIESQAILQRDECFAADKRRLMQLDRSSDKTYLSREVLFKRTPRALRDTNTTCNQTAVSRQGP